MSKAIQVVESRGWFLRGKIFSLLLVFAASSLTCASAFAQRGKSEEKNALPPVTITVDADRFEYRPELGGVYDKDMGVIWGYSFTALTDSGTSYTYAKSQIAPNYAAILEVCGDQALAGGFLEAAATYYAAADAASQYNNWRLPTLTEARGAVAGGLFTYGPDGLNIWPTVEAPGMPYGGRSAWTSDADKKLHGKDSAWLFAPWDGGALRVWQTSGIDAIIVRTYTGP